MADPQRLSQIEQSLRQPDFVLEPGCYSTIVAYVRAYGNPAAAAQSAVELLSDGYHGEGREGLGWAS